MINIEMKRRKTSLILNWITVYVHSRSMRPNKYTLFNHNFVVYGMWISLTFHVNDIRSKFFLLFLSLVEFKGKKLIINGLLFRQTIATNSMAAIKKKKNGGVFFLTLNSEISESKEFTILFTHTAVKIRKKVIMTIHA